MVALLKNVTVTYSRSIYNNATGNTAAPTPYGTIQARAFPRKAFNFMALPDAALDSDYGLCCDENTDIQEGDVINSVIVNNTGLNWPGITPNPNEIQSVVFVSEGSPGLAIESRDVYVRRARTGGPTNA